MKGENKLQTPQYHIAKVLIGNDPDYLQFVDNIKQMSRMGDNVQAFLIMDERSIEMTKNHKHISGDTYYDFITKHTECHIVTVEDLIKAQDPEIQDSIRENYQFLSRKFTNNKGEEVKAFPESLKSDFLKSVFMYNGMGNPGGVNICSDLDVVFNPKQQLPKNPEDLLGDKMVGYVFRIVYDQESIKLLTEDDKRLIDSDPELKKHWEDFVDRLKKGINHKAFVSKKFMVDLNKENVANGYPPKEFKIISGTECNIAKSLSFPLKDYMTNRFNIKYFKYIEQEVLRLINEPSFLSEGCKYVVGYMKHNFLYDGWMNNVAKPRVGVLRGPDGQVNKIEHQKALDHQLSYHVDPDAIGISGRSNIYKWRSESEEKDRFGAIHTFCRNLENYDDALKPWTVFLEDLQLSLHGSAALGALNGMDGFTPTVDQETIDGMLDVAKKSLASGDLSKVGDMSKPGNEVTLVNVDAFGVQNDLPKLGRK